MLKTTEGPRVVGVADKAQEAVPHTVADGVVEASTPGEDFLGVADTRNKDNSSNNNSIHKAVASVVNKAERVLDREARDRTGSSMCAFHQIKVL